MVYSVAGIPNDVEENMFWRLCRQTDVDHGDRHSSRYESYDACKFDFSHIRDRP